jgi:Zn-dependent protease with chaperone function
MHRTATRRFAWLIPALFATVVSAQTAGPTFPNPGKTSMSKEQQHALGMQVTAQVYQQMPVLPDSSPGSVYVRQLGKKLVATIPQEYSWPYEFHVVPQKEINAFALPGGQMFVNVGTMKAARTEAELAGVMAHEMAHVYMQHSAKQAGKAQTTGMLAGIASAVLGGTVGNKMGGLVGQLGQMGIQMGAQGLMMKYSRSDESQADAVGAMILYKAGYDPQGMADFFKTMGAEGGSAPPQFLSSHPNPANRSQAVQTQIANWPARSYSGDSAEFGEVRQRAAQVKTYSAQEIQQGAKSGQWASMNQRNGAGSNTAGDSSFLARGEAESLAAPKTVPLESVLPSGQMVSAELGPMTIQRPGNWAVTLPEQKGQFVTIAPEPGVTKSGVGYGVLLNGAQGPRGQSVSIDDLTNALIQQMQQNNELQPVGKPEPITVGGTEGRATFLESPSPFTDASGKPQKERDWLVTVPRKDGSVIFMIFIAPESDFARFQPTYEAMVKSAQFK